jgi:hypothetical protein
VIWSSLSGTCVTESMGLLFLFVIAPCLTRGCNENAKQHRSFLGDQNLCSVADML